MPPKLEVPVRTVETNEIRAKDEARLAKVLDREELRKLYVVSALATAMRPATTVIDLSDYVLGLDIKEVVQNAVNQFMDALPQTEPPTATILKDDNPVTIAFSDIDILPTGIEILDLHEEPWIKTKAGWRSLDEWGQIASHEDELFERWFLDLDQVVITNPELLGEFTPVEVDDLAGRDIHAIYSALASASVVTLGEE